MPVSGRMLVKLLTLLSLASILLAEKNKCKVCKELTDKFKEHFDKTKGHNFGGGNTAWEEKSLGTYATSETRLVEILENTCGKTNYKCGSMLEDQEEFIEEWFFNRQEKTDLFEEMCVDHLKKCCHKNRWGPDCAECPGGTEAPCNGHGKCHGEGDREKDGKLSGTCTCDKGYNGTLCEDCKRKFIRVGDVCEECSSLCEGQCTAPGTIGCVECVKGYELLEGSGCTDINECEREGMGCGDLLEDCINSAGSYECVCKSGYTRVSGKCQLEGTTQLLSFDKDNLLIIVGVHVFLLILGISSVGVRGVAALSFIYVITFGTFAVFRFYKEGHTFGF